MLQNAYLVAKIGADTAANERNFAEILPKTGNYPTGPLPDGQGRYRAMPLSRRPAVTSCRVAVEAANLNGKFRCENALFCFEAASKPKPATISMISHESASMVSKSSKN